MIENTAGRDPLLHLIGAMGGTSEYITGMESAGQRQLVSSTQIPTKGSDRLTELGIVLGPVDERDPMFRSATLPEGWTKQASDHAMWSHIVDGMGRRRVGIFYKAAFYDRDAFCSPETVYSYVNTCRYDGTRPILDDMWCTPTAVAEACEGVIRRANESIELYAGRDGDYARERVAKANTEIEWAHALIAEVSA